jgi:hypothetical protein
MSCQINVPPENLTLSWTAVMADLKEMRSAFVYRPLKKIMSKEGCQKALLIAIKFESKNLVFEPWGRPLALAR